MYYSFNKANKRQNKKLVWDARIMTSEDAIQLLQGREERVNKKEVGLFANTFSMCILFGTKLHLFKVVKVGKHSFQITIFDK